MKGHYIYILLLSNGQIYTGITNDIARRYCEHKVGKVKSTRNKRPLRIIHYEVYLLKSEAWRREKYLKKSIGKRDIRRQIRDALNII